MIFYYDSNMYVKSASSALNTDILFSYVYLTPQLPVHFKRKYFVLLYF